jgi:diketogulonate reductase-like aldo/keto reductase
MPSVALGTGEYQGAAAVAAVQSAIRLGYRAIDTAHEYGNQAAIGTAINAILTNTTHGGPPLLTRKDLFVITKVEGGLTAAETTARLQQDLQQLNLGHTLDLVLLHYPKPGPGNRTLAATIQEQWMAISAFARAGGARAVGVSQFCSVAFAALRAVVANGSALPPVLNQVGWHVGMGTDPCGVVTATGQQHQQAPPQHHQQQPQQHQQ